VEVSFDILGGDILDPGRLRHHGAVITRVGDFLVNSARQVHPELGS
jgi:hypothetical protein